MEVQGKIKVKKDSQEFGAFTKREWVIVTDDQYPQEIQLECHQDKCALLDKFQEGQDVKASINIRGKLWVSPTGEEKYFNTLVAWRIEALEEEPQQEQPPIDSNDDLDDSEPDDLPF